MPLAKICLTLSRHFSLSFIASGRSSGLHPVSSHSCWMYVRAGSPAFARSYVGVHRSTSLMSSYLFLQQCPACLVRLTWIVFVMGGRWPYSWRFVGCFRQDLFNFTWFAFLSHQEFDGRHLFKPEALCFIFLHFEKSESKFLFKKICIISKVGDRGRERPEGSLFNSY